MPQIGAKMLAANRSYRVRVSYLPAQAEQLEAAGKVRQWLVGVGQQREAAAGLWHRNWAMTMVRYPREAASAIGKRHAFKPIVTRPYLP